MALLILPQAEYVDVTPNKALKNYSGYSNSTRKVGNLVILQFSVILGDPTDWTSDELLLVTLPEGCRPTGEVNLARMLLLVCGQNPNTHVLTRGMRVKPDGGVYFKNVAGSANADVSTAICYGVSFTL